MSLEFIYNRLDEILKANQKLYQSVVGFKTIIHPNIWIPIESQKLFVSLYSFVNVNSMMMCQDNDLIIFGENDKIWNYIMCGNGFVTRERSDFVASVTNLEQFKSKLMNFVSLMTSILIDGNVSQLDRVHVDTICPISKDMDREFFKYLSSKCENRRTIEHPATFITYFKIVYPSSLNDNKFKDISITKVTHKKLNDQNIVVDAEAFVFDLTFDNFWHATDRYVLDSDGNMSSLQNNFRMPRVYNCVIDSETTTMCYECYDIRCHGIAKELSYYGPDGIVTEIHCSKCKSLLNNPSQPQKTYNDEYSEKYAKLLDENTKLKSDMEKLKSDVEKLKLDMVKLGSYMDRKRYGDDTMKEVWMRRYSIEFEHEEKF